MRKRFKPLLITMSLASVLLLGGQITHSAHASRIGRRTEKVTPPPRYNRTHYGAQMPKIRYRVKSAVHDHLLRVSRDEPIWNEPFTRGAMQTGSEFDSVGLDRLVKPKQVAYSKYRHGTYYKIERLGHVFGWVNSIGLRKTRTYKLPYRYTSQFWPSKASDACEVAALKMVLSVKGKGNRVPLAKMVKRIPRSKNPNYGYTNNPFHFGSHATINPKALAKVAKSYGVHAHPIYKVTWRRLATDIERGNPIVLEGSYRMQNTKSDHDIALLGYRPGYFYYADPLSNKASYEPHGWVKTKQLMNIFKAKYRDHQSLVIFD